MRLGPVWRRLWRDRVAGAGALVLALLFGAVPFAGSVEHLLGVSGVDVDLFSRFAPPSGLHPLGADSAGRDELARLLRGGQTSLTIGLLGALGTGVIGTVIGSISGYVRGRTDMVLMRFTDFVIAVPHLPILVILAALDLHKLGFSEAFVRSGAAAYWRVLVIVTLFGWTGVARLMRAGTMALAGREFVEAARACGASGFRVLFVHIVPNAITPVIVYTTTVVGRIILTESGLSFLGLGIQPPAASWGSMLSDAQATIGTAPLLAVLPGLLIFVTVVASNSLGDGLQTALQPRGRHRVG